MLCIPSTKHKASRKKLEGWVSVCVFHSVFPDKQEGCSLFCLFFLSYIGNHNFILPFLLSSSQSLFCCVSLGREFDNTDILIRMHLKAFSLVRTALCGINICIYICIHVSLKSSTYVEALMCLTNRYTYTPLLRAKIFTLQYSEAILGFAAVQDRHVRWDVPFTSQFHSGPLEEEEHLAALHLCQLNDVFFHAIHVLRVAVLSWSMSRAIRHDLTSRSYQGCAFEQWSFCCFF